MSVADDTDDSTNSNTVAPPPRVAGALSGPATACSCAIDSETGPAGPVLLLRVAGEIDLLTLPLVRTSLDAALAQTPCDLVVDVAAVRFCSVRGFELLAGAADAARSMGIGFALSGLNPHLERILTLLRPEGQVDRYRSAAAAVTAIRIDQVRRPI